MEPLGVTATDWGALPTGMVVVSVLVEVLTTETVLDLAFTTYSCEPSGVRARSKGKIPRVRVATTVLLGMERTVRKPGAVVEAQDCRK